MSTTTSSGVRRHRVHAPLDAPDFKVIVVTARISLNGSHAAIWLESNLPKGVSLSIIHECITSQVFGYTSTGKDQQLIEVADAESLILVARQAGTIVGSVVHEVCCDEDSRLVLLPRGGFNLFVFQEVDGRGRQRPDRHQDRVLVEPTPATAQLACRHAAARQAQLSPSAVRALHDIEPVIEEAIGANEEALSQSILSLLENLLQDEVVPMSAPDLAVPDTSQ